MNLKGNELLDQGKIEEAIEYYDKAINIDPHYLFAWKNKAEALVRKGELERAIECYDETLKIEKKLKGEESILRKVACSIPPWGAKEPYHKASYSLEQKGELLKELGRFDEALEGYNYILFGEATGEFVKNFISAWS